MGFDPRRWRPPPGSRPVTANVESLLAENEALRREVWALRQQLEGLQAAARAAGPEERWRRAGAGGQSRVSQGRGPQVTAEQVERWGEAMARHPAWSGMRIGPPGGLRGLVEELRSHWWNPALSLEEELDRRLPGLGSDLDAALRGPHSRVRWAVRAAFALYGPRAIEWLSEEPRRVVAELQRRVERLEQRPGSGPGPSGGNPDAGRSGRTGTADGQRRRGTRTANHSGAWTEGAAGGPGRAGGTGNAGGSGAGGSRARARSAPEPDPRLAALHLLGLESGASPQAIKRAYRRLAKAHHPDLGGEVEAFRRIDSAYRLLIR